ncbi:hypothetical protein HZZ02_08055, partial [Streptococcus danieliae]|nr:hypothetical protein [Streptococcus danieliae]
MDEIVRSIVIVGGFGFFNYWIATRIDDLDWGSTDDRKILIIFLSSMNYFIYTIIHQWSKNFICSLIFTFLISLLLSLYLSTILKVLGNLINRLRKDEGLPPQTNVLVWNDMSKSERVYNILCKRKKGINPAIVELDKKILLERFIPMTQFITDLTTF